MIPLVILVAVAIGSATLAAYTYAADRRRRQVLGRALGTTDGPAFRTAAAAILLPRPSEQSTGLVRLLESIVPRAWLEDPKAQQRLIHAGLEDPDAMVVYGAARVVLLFITVPLALYVGGGRGVGGQLLYPLLGFAIAWVAPRAVVDGLVRRRQDRIRKAIPDTMDLLTVCVEAGSSLEAGMTRVARELTLIHPELASELADVVRRTKAGIPRTEALRGLWTRTGIEELRTFSTNVAQSERLGTGVVRVLRVTGDTLRRKTRQRAEKQAATAALKMTIPLVTMILPPLFIVILGPSLLQLFTMMTTR